jgi:hypothetical protein
MFSPEDVFWGELGGCMESIDAGTTMVVDHAHMNYSAEHCTRPSQHLFLQIAHFCINSLLRAIRHSRIRNPLIFLLFPSAAGSRRLAGAL